MGNRMNKLILLIIGACILQFFIGLAIHQIGYEQGKKAKWPDYTVIITACYHNWTIPVGDELYKVSCLKIK